MKEQPSIFGHSLAVGMLNATPTLRPHWTDRWSRRRAVAFMGAVSALLYGIGASLVLVALWALR